MMLEQPETNAMPYWLLVFLISLSGFAVAGLINALASQTQSQTQSGTGVRLSFNSPFAMLVTFFLCMFAGPYWIGAKAVQFWMLGQLPNLITGFFLLLAVLWSFCSGVVVLQLLYFAGFV